MEQSPNILGDGGAPAHAVGSPDAIKEAETIAMDSGVTGEAPSSHGSIISRKEKRKLAKKAKRKEQRTQAAEELRSKAEAMAKDPAVQQRLLEEQIAEEQRKRVEEEQHRRDEARWLERERALAAAAAQKEEAAMRAERERARNRQLHHKADDKAEQAPVLLDQQAEAPKAVPAEESEEEIDGPSEIIWEGNQITVRKRRVKKSLVQAVAEEDHPTHNPLYVPIQLPDTASLLAQAEADADKRELCQFYMRTGACRHFDKCSRKHPYPSPSHVILVRGMFTGLGPPGVARKEDDASLEHTEAEIYREFEEFYDDVLPEFEVHGAVTNFKVCVNTGPHLRGNVYVSFKDKEAAAQAFAATHGRFYGGKQLVCEYAPFKHWRSAICGIQRTTGKCQHGGNCNYLHCFRNPGGAFAQADFDPVDHLREAAPRRHRSRSIDADTPSRATRRRERNERSVRSSSRGLRRFERSSRREVDDRRRSPDDRSGKREWSPDGGDGYRFERVQGKSSRHRSSGYREESRSPQPQRKRSKGPTETRWGRSGDGRRRRLEDGRRERTEGGRRERSVERHGGGSDEESDKDRDSGRQRSWSRRWERDTLQGRGRKGSRERRNGNRPERQWENEGRKRSHASGQQERSQRWALEEGSDPSGDGCNEVPEDGGEVVEEHGDRWQAAADGEGIETAQGAETNMEQTKSRERHAHRPRKRRRDREESKARMEQLEERPHGQSNERQRANSVEERQDERSDLCEETSGAAHTSLKVRETHGEPVENGDRQRNDLVAGSLRHSEDSVSASRSDGGLEAGSRGNGQEGQSVQGSSKPVSKDNLTDLDEHLLKLRKAVEQSFNERRMKHTKVN